MKNTWLKRITRDLNLSDKQVEATSALLAEGATVPFIARYRKERTGSLDEVQITAIRDLLKQLEEMDKRRDSMMESLLERELLTNELETKLNAAMSLRDLEDLYLPYRPKRRTRAAIARERGLEPAAKQLFSQPPNIHPETLARGYLNPSEGLNSTDDVLAGARDIIAELISERIEVRNKLRDSFEQHAVMTATVVKAKESEGQKFRDYFNWQQRLRFTPGHRLLAVYRGEAQGILRVSARPEEERTVDDLKRRFLKNSSAAARQVEAAIEDSYKRLLAPSMETELRNTAKEKADTEAIQVFTENLREILMAPPLGKKIILAVDPGFRTGCKLACIDATGKYLHQDVMYLHKKQEAEYLIYDLVEDFGIEAIAVGNGTASRETETFLRSLELDSSLPIVIVDESGASIYSASEIARKEFPDLDLTVRGAISIGRRLLDPLAELVKLDPKTIGVGQYQHDVDQKKLKQALDDTVVSCVNAVGVDVNTAGEELLSYVSGLGPKLAENIVIHRNQNGPFQTRKDLMKVAKLGAKTFEQCAGFLRVNDGKEPLDSSSVHPESYHIVKRMAKNSGCTPSELIGNSTVLDKLDLNKYISTEVGLPTLTDLVKELAKPGRDPRDSFEQVVFEETVHEISDLRPGMKLPGIITNVTNFGAFVDVGVHQDGLIHISELADKFVDNPADIVKVRQKVTVTVIDVDTKRRRVAFSMKR